MWDHVLTAGQEATWRSRKRPAMSAAGQTPARRARRGMSPAHHRQRDQGHRPDQAELDATMAVEQLAAGLDRRLGVGLDRDALAQKIVQVAAGSSLSIRERVRGRETRGFRLRPVSCGGVNREVPAEILSPRNFQWSWIC